MDTHELMVVRQLPPHMANKVRRGHQTGQYLRLATGVYTPTAVYNALPYWEKHRLRAIAFGSSGSRVIGGISAATIWGMWSVFNRTDPGEYYLKRGGTDRQKTGKQLRGTLRKTDKYAGKITEITSIARTIADLARYRGYEACFMATSWALRNRACTAADIRAALIPSLGDMSLVLQILDQVDPKVESAAEAYFLAQARQDGLIGLTPQSEIVDAWGQLRRADFHVAGTNKLVEISGMGKYGISDDAKNEKLREEKRRIDGLTTAGYSLLSYTATQVFNGFAYQDMVWRVTGR